MPEAAAAASLEMINEFTESKLDSREITRDSYELREPMRADI